MCLQTSFVDMLKPFFPNVGKTRITETRSNAYGIDYIILSHHFQKFMTCSPVPIRIKIFIKFSMCLEPVGVHNVGCVCDLRFVGYKVLPHRRHIFLGTYAGTVPTKHTTVIFLVLWARADGAWGFIWWGTVHENWLQELCLKLVLDI